MCHNRRGFTLVEVLWVIMFLGLLAGIVLPKFSDATTDAKLSNLKKNLQQVRAQLQLYRLQHNNTYPTDITAQLTSKTDEDGTINPSGTLGPYMRFFPDNRFIEDATKSDATGGAEGDGWNYTASTGTFLANSDGHSDL
ncbi:MAG: prepilin-type N-terminal cleavage/methylation domain-containing protein [bacterium]|nr:prepilin-type N-terminal cleavage/methylation domain-containing protein [bacterium]